MLERNKQSARVFTKRRGWWALPFESVDDPLQIDRSVKVHTVLQIIITRLR